MEEISRTSLLDAAVRSLKQYITSDEVTVGDRFPTEVQLCEMLGVGRSTVREAVRILCAMGYLEVRRGKGTFVLRKEETESVMSAVCWFKQDEVRIKEVLEYRRYVEPILARIAARKITDEEVRKLARIMQQFNEADHRADQVGLLLYERAFHIAVAEATHNRVFINTFKQLMSFLEDYFANSTKVRVARAQVATQGNRTHAEIFEALCQRDPERAEDAMRGHITRTIEQMEFAASSEGSKL